MLGGTFLGGLISGVGFVMGGWCPGTAASGAASGKIDAVVFLAGAVGGSILFNELFPLVKPLYSLGDRSLRFIYEDLGVTRAMFALGLTTVGVVVFWLCEWVEKLRNGRSPYLGSPFLKAFSVAYIAAAAGLLILEPGPNAAVAGTSGAAAAESDLLAALDRADDHVEPEELADRLMAGEPGLTVVDVRPVDEYAAFHIRGAINRPYTEDVDKSASFKPTEGLAAAYSALIPDKQTQVIVHCRTGHQASQTFFVLKHLLGYADVRWYDAGWTEWATKLELPVER